MKLNNMTDRPTTFYLVRHAETLGNVEEKLIGQSESPLTEVGIKQAEELAKRLENVRFGAVYASDLSRAIRTAEIIAKPHKLEITINKLIREMSFGKYEGWKSEDFMKIFGEIVEKRDKMTDADRLPHVVDPEIETDQHCAERMARFLHKTAQTHPGQNTLVISHGAIIRATMIYLGLSTYQNLPHGAVHNCGYIVLENSEKKFQIKETNGVELNMGYGC